MAAGWIDITPETDLAWSDLEAGPALAEVIAATDPEVLPGSARVSFLAACDRMNSWIQAHTVRAIDAVATATVHAWTSDADDSTDSSSVDIADLISRADRLTPEEQTTLNDACALPPASWISDEIAAALHIAAGTATRRMTTATALIHHHPRLWDALEVGAITWSQCLAMLEVITSHHTDPAGNGTDNPTPPDDASYAGDFLELADAVLDAVLPTASNYPPARLRERTRHTLTRLAPEVAAARRARATRNRTGISVWNSGDGLATLAVTGPAVDIHALTSHIRAHANALKETDEVNRASTPDTPNPDASGHRHISWDEPRSIGQWRLAAILTAYGLAPIGIPPATTDTTTPDGARAIPGLDIRIVIDLPTALGLANNPADLPGYGPLDPDLARVLAASGDWTRWITDPVHGYLLDDGDRRLPTARLARYINARDARCDAPSCSRTTRLDIDHTPPYATTGLTNADTLTRACIRHNRSRDKAKWHTPGSRTWVSALGRRYTTLLHQPLPRPEPDDDPPPF